jgi:hypothetical protein
MQDDYVPDDQNDYGRGRLVTKEMLKVNPKTKPNQTKPNQNNVFLVRESKTWPLEAMLRCGVWQFLVKFDCWIEKRPSWFQAD